MIYATIIVASIGGLAGPSAQAIVSRSVPPTEQGLLQGSLLALQSVAGVAGPLIGGGVFRVFTGPEAPVYFPGAPFMAGAILTAGAIVPMVVAWSRMRRPESGDGLPESRAGAEAAP